MQNRAQRWQQSARNLSQEYLGVGESIAGQIGFFAGRAADRVMSTPVGCAGLRVVTIEDSIDIASEAIREKLNEANAEIGEGIVEVAGIVAQGITIADVVGRAGVNVVENMVNVQDIGEEIDTIIDEFIEGVNEITDTVGRRLGLR